MSITLTTATDVVINGVQVEDDTTAALTGLNVDWTHGTATFTFQSGVVSSNVLVPGSYGPSWQVVVNLATGAYTGPGVSNGQLSAAQLSVLQTDLAQIRNGAESLMTATGVIPGTQVAWSSTAV